MPNGSAGDHPITDIVHHQQLTWSPKLDPAVGPVLREAEVDLPVRVASRSSPRYPGARLGTGTIGWVQLSYIVNALGCVEPKSFRVLAATDSLFAAAAREALQRFRFHPAERGGVKVRQVIVQTTRIAPPDPTK